MSREYRHVKGYEEKIIELKEKGLTKREIGEKLGISFEQVKGVLQRKRRREEKQANGIMPKPKGRPRKDGTELAPSIQQLSRVTQLQYELESKKRYIKRLEMENELMRDFLSLTERK